MESDTLLANKFHNITDVVLENLEDIRDDYNEAELLPQNIKILSETVESENLTANTTKIKAEATNVSQQL